MPRYFTILPLLISLAWTQISLPNGNFQAGLAGWTDCAGSSIDPQPGVWGVSTPSFCMASAGYAGMVCRSSTADSYEAMTAQLGTALSPQSSYRMEVSLAFMPYAAAGFNAPAQLQLFGAMSNCSEDTLLWSSGPATSSWVRHTIQFTASRAFTHLVFRAYYVQPTRHSGNVVLDELSPLVETPTPVDGSLGPDTTICNNSTLTLSAPPGATSYIWENGDMSQSKNVTGSGLYRYTATFGASCESISDTIQVNFSSVTDPALPDTIYLCGNQSITLDALNNRLGTSYLWSNGQTNQTQTFNTEGLVWVEINNNGCILRDSSRILSASVPPAIPDTILCGFSFFRVASDHPPYQTIWQDIGPQNRRFIPDTGTYSLRYELNGCVVARDTFVVSDALTRTYLPAEVAHCFQNGNSPLPSPAGLSNIRWQPAIASGPGTYTLTAEALPGCQIMEQLRITDICEAIPQLTNAFSPNGDGLNEHWPHTSFVQLSIYNRWGTKIYEDKVPWDGGEAPEGVYVFHIEFENGLRRTGTLTLLR